MCQRCVDEGEMSQELLDAAILAGDRGVIPLSDLPPDERRRIVVESISNKVEDGTYTYAEAEEMVEILAAADAVGTLLGLWRE
jgi:hypothetical protein